MASHTAGGRSSSAGTGSFPEMPFKCWLEREEKQGLSWDRGDSWAVPLGWEPGGSGLEEAESRTGAGCERSRSGMGAGCEGIGAGWERAEVVAAAAAAAGRSGAAPGAGGGGGPRRAPLEGRDGPRGGAEPGTDTPARRGARQGSAGAERGTGPPARPRPARSLPDMHSPSAAAPLRLKHLRPRSPLPQFRRRPGTQPLCHRVLSAALLSRGTEAPGPMVLQKPSKKPLGKLRHAQICA